jgi:transcription elongation GreA/GreB family factor
VFLPARTSRRARIALFRKTPEALAAILFWMSRAFVKEDVDPPERSGRKRSASGLPPGATNYITARGAKRLREELQNLRASNAGSERIIELENILASIHVVDPPDTPSNSVTFGATVTVKDKKGATETFTIVGVDELDFERDAVSWISPIGKALLAADMGDWIAVDDGRTAKIVKIERKSDM